MNLFGLKVELKSLCWRREMFYTLSAFKCFHFFLFWMFVFEIHRLCLSSDDAHGKIRGDVWCTTFDDIQAVDVDKSFRWEKVNVVKSDVYCNNECHELEQTVSVTPPLNRLAHSTRAFEPFQCSCWSTLEMKEIKRFDIGRN